MISVSRRKNNSLVDWLHINLPIQMELDQKGFNFTWREWTKPAILKGLSQTSSTHISRQLAENANSGAPPSLPRRNSVGGVWQFMV